jgi:hypothetical protein
MNTGARLAAFGVGLAALFAAGFAAGVLVGDDDRAAPDRPGTEREGEGVSGLHSSEAGYTFVPEVTEIEPGRSVDFRFRITGPDGHAVRDYRPQHERDLHLILASRDLGWFSHVHPVRDGEGVWSVPLRLPAAGPYRAFADFAAAGDGPALTLGVDLAASGEHTPRPLPAPSSVSTVDGYRVELEGKPTRPGEAELALTVTRGGSPVTDLEPYLGAYGHVVALRAGDLAYLHVHPEGDPGDGTTAAGPEVRFGIHLPTAGDYRLFFDFQHGGTVRTADFTVSVKGDGGSPGGGHGPAHG